MEWLLAHGDDPSLDEPFTEEEALQMKSNLEAPLEAAKKPLTEEEKAEIEQLKQAEEAKAKKKAEKNRKRKERKK